MARKRPSVDFLSIAGITLSLVVVIGGNMLEGGHTDALFQLTAFIIVIGGTLGAILVQTPLSVFLLALKRIRWIVLPLQFDRSENLKKVLRWSKISRTEGLLGLQKIAEKEKEPFTRKGLMLLVDGNEPDQIRKILEVELDNLEAHDLKAAKVYESMGGYSPTIGIIGAVMGLIHVMNNLADPSALGPGIAVAFVATIYGVGFANFFFLPIANKLKSIVSDHAHFREMLVEGVVSIAEGENPRVIETRLEGYLI